MSYANLLVKSVRSRSFSLGEFLINNINLFAQAVISVYVGLYFNSIRPVFSGDEIFIYYLFGVGLINLFQRRAPYKNLEKDIAQDNIAVHLAKPYNFINYYLFKDFAHKLYDAAVNFIFTYLVIGVFFSFIVLPWEMTARALAIIPITVFFIYLNMMVFMYLELSLEKIAHLAVGYNMLGFFIGGGLVSTSYFPAFVRYLPQQFFFDSPLKFIISGTFANLWVYCLYWLFFAALNYSLYRFSMKKLSINGG